MTSQLLGSGAYGSVYEENFKGETVALKIFNDNTFVREADILFRINHPCLVRGIEMISRSENPEFFEGRDGDIGIFQTLADGNLFDFFEQFDDFNLDREKVAEQLLIDLCRATTALVQGGYYHMDIKPENILYLLTEDEVGVRFMLCDYGLCLKLPSDEFTPELLYNSWREVGTRIYLPSESSISTNGEVQISAKSMSWQIALSVLSMLNGECIALQSVTSKFNSSRSYDEFHSQIPSYMKLLEDTDLEDVITKMMKDYKKRITPMQVLKMFNIKESKIQQQCVSQEIETLDSLYEDIETYGQKNKIYDYDIIKLATDYAHIASGFFDNIQSFFPVFFHMAYLFYEESSPFKIKKNILFKMIQSLKFCLSGLPGN